MAPFENLKNSTKDKLSTEQNTGNSLEVRGLYNTTTVKSDSCRNSFRNIAIFLPNFISSFF